MNTKIESSRSEKIACAISILLLFMLGVTAMFGGAGLVIDPSGKRMGLSLDLLQNTFFSDYKLPGIVLFFMLGVLGMSAAFLGVVRHKYFPMVVLYEGIILTIWIMTQIYVLPAMHMLQVIYGLIGLTLILLGNFMRIKSHNHYMKVIY